MNWHTKTIVRNSVALLVSLFLTVLAVMLLKSSIRDRYTSGTFLFGFMSVFMGIVDFFNCKQLIVSIKKQQEASNNKLIEELKHINPYRSKEELFDLFNLQKRRTLYQDNKIVITKDFIARHSDNQIFVIDGILDAVSVVHKVNGVIDYVSLIFLYYDGKRYEIKYRRLLGTANMQEKANNINAAANIIINRSKNFRKYPSYRLTD